MILDDPDTCQQILNICNDALAYTYVGSQSYPNGFRAPFQRIGTPVVVPFLGFPRITSSRLGF